MAALANAAYFVPTAVDTYIQAQGTGTTPPNAGLALILLALTRAAATVVVTGFTYQGSGEQVAALARYVADTWVNR